MVYLYAACVILVCSWVLLNVYQLWFVEQIRRNGKLLPIKGKITMFDVRHLLREGKKEQAIQLYCELFNTNSTKAKKDVEELERSLKV